MKGTFFLTDQRIIFIVCIISFFFLFSCLWWTLCLLTSLYLCSHQVRNQKHKKQL
jgi:hypothetical protein